MTLCECQDFHGEPLLQTHGPLMGGRHLWRALGYPTAQAFSKAVERNTVPIATFRIPHRRGRFALTNDVVQWLHLASGRSNHAPS